MMKRNALVALLLAIMMIFCVAVSGCKSCDDDDGQQNQQQPDPSNPIEPEKPEGEKDSITLNVGTLDLYIGESQTLVATVLPETADKTVIWTSDKTTVATVVDGKVTAVAKGTAIITVKSAVNQTATCVVTVSEKTGTHIPAVSIDISQNEATLETGQSLFLTATVQPSDSTETLVWSSSDALIASVDQEGKVIAKAAGKASISATLSGSKKAVCNVTVIAPAIIDSKITYSAIFNESSAFEWKDSNAVKSTVQYKLSSAGESAFVAVDEMLIR